MIALLLEELAAHGVLLKTDPKLPNAALLIAREPVRGSWWAHPKSHQIFHALNQLAAHPDVLMAKLISSKDTFVHRTMWPVFLAVALSHEPWQMKSLDTKSRRLLKNVEAQGRVEASGPSASALEKSLLVHGEQVHTKEGSHAKVLASWETWMRVSGITRPTLTPGEARASLEKLVAHLNARYGGRATLPWTHSSAR